MQYAAQGVPTRSYGSQVQWALSTCMAEDLVTTLSQENAGTHQRTTCGHFSSTRRELPKQHERYLIPDGKSHTTGAHKLFFIAVN